MANSQNLDKEPRLPEKDGVKQLRERFKKRKSQIRPSSEMDEVVKKNRLSPLRKMSLCRRSRNLDTTRNLTFVPLQLKQSRTLRFALAAWSIPTFCLAPLTRLIVSILGLIVFLRSAAPRRFPFIRTSTFEQSSWTFIEEHSFWRAFYCYEPATKIT